MMKIKASFVRKNLFVNYATGGGNDQGVICSKESKGEIISLLGFHFNLIDKGHCI
ncbi:hypothetical protein NC651_026713 [Populus alba x Populus x berolinensis]|nr:hypothetical protein NC651_026713 [Populus alba x Populus x berolinensis]